MLLLTNGLSASSTVTFGNANGSVFSFNSTTGNLGLGTSTPYAQFAILATSTTGVGSPMTLFAIASTTAGTATTTLFSVINNGKVGIGTSSPFAKLSIITNNAADEFKPAFVIATSSVWTAGQYPLLFVSATTTGGLNYERIGIGTTTVWGTGGLRDQLTVDGRVYSTWRYLSCDIMTGSQINTLAYTADPATIQFQGLCGQFVYDFNVSGQAMPFANNTYSYIRLTANSGTAGTATTNGAMIRTASPITTPGENPVFEAWVQASTSPAATTTPMYQVGFTSNVYGTNPNTLPAEAAYFIATSTAGGSSVAQGTGQTWKAVIRHLNLETMVDTGISTSTTGVTGTSTLIRFQKLRVELSSSSANFLINGTVVAVMTGANLPQGPLSPQILVNIFSQPAGGNFAWQPRINVSLMRVWVDDPPGGESSYSGSNTQAPPTPYDRVSGADISQADLVHDPGSYIAGMLVSNATSTLVGSTTPMVRRSVGRYDSNIFGVVSTSPYALLGQESVDTIRVATLGRVPVIVSLENGPIAQGDRIAASAVEGVGMKALRSGSVVGVAIDSFATSTPASVTSCDAALASQLQSLGVAVPEGTCLATVLVALAPGSDTSIGSIFQDVTNSIATMADALAELANSAFEKGAQLTKFVVGQIVAKVAVIGEIFTNRLHTKELCVADDAGGETCITKEKLDALLSGAAASGSSSTPSSGGSGSSNSSSGSGPTPDTTPPVITILGNNPATIDVGVVYSDLGATVSDNVDQNLGYTTFVDGVLAADITLDTSTPATHAIDYVATDTAGNTATSTRSVVVQ